MKKKSTSATLVASLILITVMGCDLDPFLNQTASFGPDGGGSVAGAPLGSGLRGNINVNFENNTPFRAVFTTGVFDNTDERTTPVFFQFSPDTQIQAVNASATLEANSSTGLTTLPCARVLSVGSRSLINLIDTNPGAFAPMIDEPALIDGVGFSDANLASAAAAIPNQGFAAGFEALLGVDFNCGSAINVRFEFAEIGNSRFRVEIDVIPSRGDQ